MGGQSFINFIKYYPVSVLPSRKKWNLPLPFLGPRFNMISTSYRLKEKGHTTSSEQVAPWVRQAIFETPYILHY